MSWLDTLDADAQKAATALAYGAKVDWGTALKALEETFTKPATAVTDGSVNTDLAMVEDVLKIAGVFFPPAAIVANYVAVGEAALPLIVDGMGLLISIDGGAIPEVTTAQETYIEDRFQKPFKVEKPND